MNICINNLKNKKNAFLTIILSVIFFLYACLILTAYGAVRDFEKEVNIGQKLADRLEKRYNLLEDADKLDRVKTIGENLKKASDISEINYQFNIIAKEGINAFSFPGGFIYLTEDLFDYVHSDDELAAVIAHEMGHVIHQHSIKQIQDNRKMKLVELFAVLLTGDPSIGLIGELTTITMLNNYRREYEEEADFTALELLSKSRKYHPVGLLTFFERVYSEEYFKANVNLGIFQTHPEIDYRIEKIKKYLEDNNINIERFLTTNYFTVDAAIRIKKDFIVSIIYLNKQEIIRFTGKEVVLINEKTVDIIKNLNNSLRLDLDSYELIVHSANKQSSLRVGNTHIVSLSNEEILAEDLGHSEVLENTKKSISKILWEVKLQLPVLLFDD